MGPVNVSWEAIALTLSRALRGSVLRKGCGAIANRRLGIVVDESEADGHPRGAPLIIRLGRGAFPNETYFVHKKMHAGLSDPRTGYQRRAPVWYLWLSNQIASDTERVYASGWNLRGFT
jgi:hypothetical protein